MNVTLLGDVAHYPLEQNVEKVVKSAFWDVLGLAAGIGDEFVVSTLNENYVNSFTDYYVELVKERKRVAEIAKVDARLKGELDAMTAEVLELQQTIRTFEHEYKDVKANYEDQDFGFVGLQMNVIPYQEQVLITNNDKSKKTLPVLLELKIGKEPETKERVPFSLAIILDRSGSMQGSKLQNCQLAIKNIIEKMNDNDLLHFITYDDWVENVFVDGKKENKEELVKKVDKVWARNMTNISLALEKTRDVFRQSTSNYHKRAFLFSDGQANAGLTQPSQLHDLAREMQENDKINLSTFGIGEDFNYEIMDGIARFGHGSYFFIEDSGNIPKLVDKGLRGLTSLLATDAFLKIKPKEGVKVVKVYGHKNTEQIPVGDLRFGDLKQILVDLEFDFSKFSEKNEKENVLDFELVFNSQEKDKETPFLPPSGIQKNLELVFTRNHENVANQFINHQVEVTKVIKESADLDTQALSAFRVGDIAKAVECKRKKMQDLERVSLFDRYGFTKVLLQKTRKTLLDFMEARHRQKLTQYYSAISEINSKYRKKKYYAESASYISSGQKKSEVLMDKQLAYEAMQEEDDDMGFSLFD